MEEVARIVRDAFKVLSTDQETIIKVISNCTNHDKQELKAVYARKFGRVLENDFKSHYKGNFLKTILALFQPIALYEAECVYNALQSFKTNHKVLRHVLCTKQPFEIEQLKEAFEHS